MRFDSFFLSFWVCNQPHLIRDIVKLFYQTNNHIREEFIKTDFKRVSFSTGELQRTYIMYDSSTWILQTF